MHCRESLLCNALFVCSMVNLINRLPYNPRRYGNMKKALICVSFGTSVPAARVNIESVEQVIQETCPDADFFRAFTSPTIRRILQSRGETVLSLEETLRNVEKAGYQDVIVQPTHFLFGTEYDKIRAAVQVYSSRFRTLLLGRPLLASQKDLDRVADYFMKTYPAEAGRAVVLFGHGTLHFANTTYPALQTVFHIRHRPDILVGTAEGWPTVQDVREELRDGEYTSVTLVPAMLVNGDHVMNDLTGDKADSWKSILLADGCEVTCVRKGLGTEPDILNLYRDHFEALLRGEDNVL